jgi:hypothetical protein
MNILIKLMSVVSLVLAPWFARIHGVTVSDAATGWDTLLAGMRQVIAAMLG